MPTYDIRVTATGEEKEVICSISEKEEKVASGEWEQFHDGKTGMIVTHVGGTLKKCGGDWKNHLERMKKVSGRGNTIET